MTHAGDDAQPSDHDVPSARTDGDSWEITESVGATALGVAASRAVETASADPLIRDEFAYLLVSAAGPAWTRLASPDQDWIGDDEQARRLHQLACDYQAVRTHFFDAYFDAAARAGIRQAVILAAGLDARAYRLDWPAGTTVYEIDQPKVLEYKTDTLESHGAFPKATRRPVPVDLRDDWPAVLTDAGFDTTQPTAWLAEGLLPYLPPDAQDRLFERLTALSAPGSRVAVEAFRMGAADNERRRAARRARFERMRERLGLSVNVEALTYHDDGRADAGTWLTDHGWQVYAVGNAEEMARLGRPIPQDLVEATVTSTLLRARLVAAG
ncbi:class I SAM-dependent methyltransferase [Mycobacterium sp.]|uniref:class I SAM-dependent methyltransferase n=1 Tax=Mycobacterium sp. TaxID=1785 RepID=UPI0031DE2B31